MSNAIVTNATKFLRGDGGTGPGAATHSAVNGTGNGTMGAVTVSSGAKVGTYTVTIIGANTNAGVFKVVDPDGIIVGTGTVGIAYNNAGLAFTISDGSTDFIVGDFFTITVTSTSAEVFSEIPEVVSIKPGTPSAPQIDVSHLGSTRREKRGGLPDTGTMSVTMNFIKGDAVQEAMDAEAGTNVVRNYRIMFPGYVSSSNHKGGKQYSLVLTSFGFGDVDLDGRYQVIATFEVNGQPVEINAVP